MGRGKSKIKKKVRRRKEKKEKKLQVEGTKENHLIASEKIALKINGKNIDPYNFSTINPIKKRIPRYV